jgi:hypothetical protein
LASPAEQAAAANFRVVIDDGGRAFGKTVVLIGMAQYIAIAWPSLTKR